MQIVRPSHCDRNTLCLDHSWLFVLPSWGQLHVGCRCLSRQQRWQRRQWRQGQAGLWSFWPSSSIEWSSSLVRVTCLLKDFDLLCRCPDSVDTWWSLAGEVGQREKYGRRRRWWCACGEGERSGAPPPLHQWIQSLIHRAGYFCSCIISWIISFNGIVYKKDCTLCKWNGGNCIIFSPGEQNSCQRGTLMF